jgi:hypothetical protein
MVKFLHCIEHSRKSAEQDKKTNLKVELFSWGSALVSLLQVITLGNSQFIFGFFCLQIFRDIFQLCNLATSMPNNEYWITFDDDEDRLAQLSWIFISKNVCRNECSFYTSSVFEIYKTTDHIFETNQTFS